MQGKFDNILGTIGHTPIVRIAKLAPPNVNVFAKLEAFNPMGSIKDRLALGVIEDAERRGVLAPGQTVIEATSGNTGIGLAMVCAVLCRQFDNEANADMHSRTTAPEILAAFEGERLDYWVTGYGTGGTLKGVARVLKAQRPDTQVVVCEPDNSPVLASAIPQLRHPDGTPADSHPSFRPHLMQGWAPDFIPKLTEDAVAARLVDRILPVSGAAALRRTRELAQQEGIFCGISGGATLAGALELAATLPAGSTVLCMLPDTGERYLSTPLFEDVRAEMSADELAISRSTPGARFEAAPTPVPAPAVTRPDGPVDEPVVTPEVADFVAGVLADREQPLVLFALEWCEFCWALRKLFARAGMPYRAIDLDSTAYQRDNRGGQIRAALRARTGSRTIPQVFVGGAFIGACWASTASGSTRARRSIRTASCRRGCSPADPATR